MKNDRKSLKLKQPQRDVEERHVVLNKQRSNNRFMFNFSFLTTDKKYSLAGLSNRDQKIHKRLLSKLEFLSKQDVVIIHTLPKEQGLEWLPESAVSFRVNTEFITSKRDAAIGKGFWIFRLADQGRVIGKIDYNVFYILAIDTSFSTYKH